LRAALGPPADVLTGGLVSLRAGPELPAARQKSCLFTERLLGPGQDTGYAGETAAKASPLAGDGFPVSDTAPDPGGDYPSQPEASDVPDHGAAAAWRCAPARCPLRAAARLSSFSRQYDPVTGTGSPVPAPDRQRQVTLPEGTREGSRNWVSNGACYGADTELFFPIATAGRALGQISSAKAVCGRCKVRAACLSYALETMQHGIWGGTTEDERAALRAASAARPAARRLEGETHRTAPAQPGVPAGWSALTLLREAGPA